MIVVLNKSEKNSFFNPLNPKDLLLDKKNQRKNDFFISNKIRNFAP